MITALKKTLSLLLIFALLLVSVNITIIPASAEPGDNHDFAGGSGTEADPWLISTPAQLDKLRDYVGNPSAGKYWKMTADIDLSEYLTTGAGFTAWGASGWNPLGKRPIGSPSLFKGSLDGNGYCIKNLTISRSGQNDIGLFVTIDSTGEVKNLGIASGSISGKLAVGSVAAYNYGIIKNCYNLTNIVASSNLAGGLVGENNKNISNCLNTGSITGASNVGGIIGSNGLISSTITACINTGSINSSDANAGGIVGSSQGSIIDCGNTGNIIGYSGVGGIVGYSLSTSKIQNSYHAGTITGNSDLGGIAGKKSGTVTNCFYDTGLYNGDAGGGTGKTTAEMKTKATFTAAGWDFTGAGGGNPVWYMTDGMYPQLYWQIADSGDGSSEANAFVITKPYQLDNIRSFTDTAVGYGTNRSNGVYWKLGGNIDLAGYCNKWNTYNADGSLASSPGWLPVGSWTENKNSGFIGNFVGAGFKISGLKINRSSDYNGLFGYVEGGKINNLGIISCNITGGNQTGGLVGQVLEGSITGCYTTGKVTGSASCGGLAGILSGTNININGCYSECTVISSGAPVGGLVGIIQNGTIRITQCYATGSVSGKNNVGGLIGAFNNNSIINSCYATGNVKGDYNIGGFAGNIGVGGFSKCYASGNVTGIDTNYYRGGFAGYIVNGNFTNCYSVGNVTGSGFIGGFAGYSNNGNFSNCYASGRVENVTRSGGFIGEYNNVTLTACFFDSEASGKTNAAGTGTSSGITGKTTAEMKRQATFTFSTDNEWSGPANWSFSVSGGNMPVWAIDEDKSYPFFFDSKKIYKEGTGSEADPYIIKTAFQLDMIRVFVETPVGTDSNKSKDTYWKLGNNIDLSAYCNMWNTYNPDGSVAESPGWLPIGSSTLTGRFHGHLDGAGFKISGLKINRSSNYNGLFGAADSCSIKNLGIVSCDITGSESTGGLIGYLNAGCIDNCYSTGIITGTDHDTGGLAGSIAFSGIISNSYSECMVINSDSFDNGGLIGCVYNGTVTNSYASGSVIGNINSNNSMWNGGLVGTIENGRIGGCYATGNVIGNSYIGGLIGNINDGSVENCYASGDSNGSFGNGSFGIGGLIGRMGGGGVRNCYSSGTVTGDYYVGGAVGMYNDGTFTACFFDSDNAGTANAAGWGAPSGITGKTTAEMRTVSTYTGWDFTGVWGYFEKPIIGTMYGYPVIKTIGNDVLITPEGGSKIFDDIEVTDAPVWTASAKYNADLHPLTGDLSFSPTPVKDAGTYDIKLGTLTGPYQLRIKDDVKYTILAAPTFTVTIPATVNFDGITRAEVDDPNKIASQPLTVSASNVSNLYGKEVQVTISSDFNLKNGAAELPYTVFDSPSIGVKPLRSGEIFASFTGDGTVNGRIDIDRSNILFAGTYSDTLTFTVALATP